VPLGSQDPQRLGTLGDGRGATTVSSPRETTKKRTVEASSLHHLQRDGEVT